MFGAMMAAGLGLDAARAQTLPAEAPPASTAPATAPATRPQVFHPGFLVVWAQIAAGFRADPADPGALPAPACDQWQALLQAQQSKDLPAQARALTDLAHTYADSPRRLDFLAQRAVGKSFDMWLAETRWQAIKTQCRMGRFDLADVTDIEKPALIGILRQETQAAVDPVRSFLPAAGAPAPEPGSKNDPLNTITVENCIETHAKAAYAAAVLQAQLTLEPTMPGVDRTFLVRQLYAVRRALNRAMQLEPQAKAAEAKRQQDQRIQEEKARHDAARPSTSH
jgi:hypothetical protein